MAKFAEAIRLYRQSVQPNAVSSDRQGKSVVWVLFVADTKERNMLDQKEIEVALMRHHGVRVMRKTFDEISELAELDAHNRLWV